MDVTSNRIRFDATLHPHCSLSRRGFKILMGFLGVVSCVMGVVFLSIGAWPVFGFFGLDVLAVYWAFRLNYRASTQAETIRLSDQSLIVGHITPGGQYSEWRFEPYWVRVTTEDTRPYETRVILTSHGRRVEIGRFLSATERIELARSLEAALNHLRNGRNQPFLPNPSTSVMP